MDRDDGVQYFLQQFSTFIMADSFIGGRFDLIYCA